MPQRILGRPEIFIDTGGRDREFGQVRFANDLHVTLAGDCQAWRIGLRGLVRLLEKLRTAKRHLPSRSGVIRAGRLSFSRRPPTEVANPRLSVISGGGFGRVVGYWATRGRSINEDKPVVFYIHRAKK